MVRCNGISQGEQNPSICDILGWEWFFTDVFEKRNLLYIGRLVVPAKVFPFWRREFFPVIPTVENHIVNGFEVFYPHRAVYRVYDFLLRRPYVAQVHRIAI